MTPEQKLDSVTVEDKTITVTVTVTNTGDVAGKSVVQIYAQTPYGEYEQKNKVEKSAIQLLDFGKTGMLEPGASETLTIFPHPLQTYGGLVNFLQSSSSKTSHLL